MIISDHSEFLFFGGSHPGGWKMIIYQDLKLQVVEMLPIGVFKAFGEPKNGGYLL